MIDKPDIDERTLAAEVAAAWSVDVVDLVFMPVGLDGHAWAYRVETADGGRYFLKVRRGDFTPAAVLLPSLLRAQGLRQVVAPLDHAGAGRGFGAIGSCSTRSTTAAAGGAVVSPTASGSSTAISGSAAPGHAERGGGSRPAGRAVPIERGRTAADPRRAGRVERGSGCLLEAVRSALHRLAESVDDLASRVTPGQHVICHADIHPGNLIADGDGPLHVVDWDAPILAPRERT
ncbi:phosphotransferase [Micromonospora sp. BRA006-A]|nr:phosphotransferase [Micromonospora sp. BRA006-A]